MFFDNYLSLSLSLKTHVTTFNFCYKYSFSAIILTLAIKKSSLYTQILISVICYLLRHKIKNYLKIYFALYVHNHFEGVCGKDKVSCMILGANRSNRCSYRLGPALSKRISRCYPIFFSQ